MLNFVMPQNAFASSADKPSSWAEASVDTAIGLGLVPASLQSKYTQAITRAEFCALVVALYEISVGHEINGRIYFDDSTDINVAKAASVGVITGTGSNKFSPDATLTREQAAVMVSRLAAQFDSYWWESKSAVTYDDSDKISDWAIDWVGAVSVNGIMGGVGNNTFAPKGQYTREQSIVTMMRLYNYIIENIDKQPIKTYVGFPEVPMLENVNRAVTQNTEYNYMSRRDYGDLKCTVYSFHYDNVGNFNAVEELAKEYSDYLQVKGFRSMPKRNIDIQDYTL
jgi:hypothetical protein